MQLCHIHFYHKIAREKVARVNAALHAVEIKISLVFGSSCSLAARLQNNVFELVSNKGFVEFLLYIFSFLIYWYQQELQFVLMKSFQKDFEYGCFSGVLEI